MTNQGQNLLFAAVSHKNYFTLTKMLIPKCVSSSAEDLDWEGAVLLSQEGVHPLPSVLVNRRTDGPNEAEGEPEFHRRTKIFFVRYFYLE